MTTKIDEEDATITAPNSPPLTVTTTTTTIAETLKEIRGRYAESFTVHGLSHIVGGRLPEKILWTVLVLGALVGTGFMTYGLFESYFDHEVTSEFIVRQNLEIPAATLYICDKDSDEKFACHCNCSSNASKSYDPVKCESLNRDCPRFASSSKQNHSCPAELHGQCIAFNVDGTQMHTFQDPQLLYGIGEVAQEHFPLLVYILPPGSKDVLINVIISRDYHYINKPGTCSTPSLIAQVEEPVLYSVNFIY